MVLTATERTNELKNHMPLRMSLLKLQSSDGVIFSVDAATVKQMVTIQTMIDHEDTMPQNAQFAHLFQTIFFKFFFLGGNGQFGPSIHKN